jgi:hypothetical protein
MVSVGVDQTTRRNRTIRMSKIHLLIHKGEDHAFFAQSGQRRATIGGGQVFPE